METGERMTVIAQMWQPTIIKQPLIYYSPRNNLVHQDIQTIYRLPGDVLIHVLVIKHCSENIRMKTSYWVS